MIYLPHVQPNLRRQLQFVPFLQVMGLTTAATQKEIKSAYKSFALKYHPDKEKDPVKKKEKAEKFMEIQRAYDILSKLKQGRSKKNEL